MQIITLTLAPAYDIHCRCDTFAAQQENLAHILSYDAGGKGVNISRALTVYGVKNKAIVLVGNENADAFLTAINRESIDSISLQVEGRIRENITLHQEGQKETRISFPGFRAPLEVLEKVEKLVLDLAGELPTVVTLTGRLPEGILMKDVKSMLSRFHERGIRTVIDSRSFTLADLIEVKPYLIKPNEEEIFTYMHREVNSISDALAAARELHECGITNVMISMGAKGAVLVSEEGEFTACAPAITPVSTIGAGDSSIAGYLAALSRGERAKTCLYYAIAFGSAACLTEGTKSPNVSDIERFLQK